MSAPEFGLVISGENFSGPGFSPASYGSPNPTSCTGCDTLTTSAPVTCRGFCDGFYVQYAHFVFRFPTPFQSFSNTNTGQFKCSKSDPVTVQCDANQTVVVPQ